MATKMGAAGVRIELKDSSAYSIVENPNAVAGVVGFASKGELNKILTLKNTADQNNKIGYGYNNAKYNQGMYAARAVLNAGGYVEYVRPYGETIDKSDPYKRDLKTDCFVVAFDKNAARYDDMGAPYAATSLNIKHFASTRYKTDGAAEFGVSRKINNISETIAEGSNVNFNLDAGDEFHDSAACRWYDPKKKLTPTDTVLFSIMNSDPSSANRAFDRYEVQSTIHTSGMTIQVTLNTLPTFNVGERVYIPMSDGGTTSAFAVANVTGITDYEVTLEVETPVDYFLKGNQKPNVLLYTDTEDAIADGYDYLTVKTAVAGRGVKTLTSLNMGIDSIYTSNLIPNGSLVEFFDIYKNPYVLRFYNSNCTDYTTLNVKSGSAAIIADDDVNYAYTLKLDSADSVCAGDLLKVNANVTLSDETKDPEETTYTRESAKAVEIGTTETKEQTSKVVDGVQTDVTVTTTTTTITGCNPIENTTRYEVQYTITTVKRIIVTAALEFNLRVTASDISSERVTGTVDVSDDVNIEAFLELADEEWTGVVSTVKIAEFVDSDYPEIDISGAVSWTDVSAAINSVLYDDSVGYRNAMVVNDIESFNADYPYIVKVAPSATFDYSIGDTVVVVRGKNAFDTTGFNTEDDATETKIEYDSANTYCTATIVDINTMSGEITLDTSATDYLANLPKVAYTQSYKENDETVEAKVYYTYQLINTTMSTMSVYSATTSESWTVSHKASASSVESLGIDIPANNTEVEYTKISVAGLNPSMSDSKYDRGDLVTLSYFLVTDNPDFVADDKTTKPKTLVLDEAGNPTKQTISFVVETVSNSVVNGIARVSKYRAPVVQTGVDEEGNAVYNYNAVCTESLDQLSEADVDKLDEYMKKQGIDGYFTVECDKSYGRDWVDSYLISSYSMYVAAVDQDDTQCLLTETNSPFAKNFLIKKGAISSNGKSTVIVERSAKVLADAGIGATFLSLGLASTAFADVNFNGDQIQTYVLNSDGEAIARMFVGVDYKFGGKLYSFEGTIVQYVHNDTQLYIGDAAEAELADSGATFVINGNSVIDNFLENNSYDLSQTVVNGTLDGSLSCISFNPDDPAIKYDAVWSYSPINNRSSSTLSTAWNLFLDKDNSDVTMLVSAGVGINNLFMKNLETLNTQVIQAMLNICELRKDCFAICDGVGEAKLATALKKNILATGFGSQLGRWGAIYDGRGIFFDSIYTMSNVEVVKSVQMASLITSNRAGGVWWNVPAGKIMGIVPSMWGTKEKYPRRFSYPEDPDSDIAKLSNIHCNPTRCTTDGMYIWGDFTMQMEDTAFNQIHVAMLMAGVHKSFYKYLDDKVFRLNTTNLRAQITSDLQAKLNAIMNANPAGFYEAVVICDDTNNTPDIIDQNKLMVDLKVKPTKSTRYIYLRSEVLATSDGNQITTTLV